MSHESAPIVSILVPVYNRETLIRPCIESALAQTVERIEIVVSDNASTDGTWSEIQRLAAQDSRIRACRNEENLGAVPNWLRCLALARAPLVKLLFSDDMIAPSYLERTLPFLDNQSVGFVFTMAGIGPEPPGRNLAYRWRETSGVFSSQQFLADLISCGGDVPVSPGVALFRRKDMQSFLKTAIPAPAGQELFAHGAGLDQLLFLLAAQNYSSVGYVCEMLSFFRAHPGSLTIGNGRRLETFYHQTAIWFAYTYGYEDLLARRAALAWVMLLQNERRVYSRVAIARRYLYDPPAKIHWWPFILGICDRLAWRLRKSAQMTDKDRDLWTNSYAEKAQPGSISQPTRKAVI
jgi:glycosyltransferase involved in cell wall biosynthesis